MMNTLYNFRAIFTAVLVVLIQQIGSAQCPTVFNFNGFPSSEPYWYSCTGNDYSFNLQSPNNWGAYTVDWGDGTPVTSGASWISPTAINHLYTSAVDTFVVTISEISSGCVITGVVVMEEASSASIQIPVGGLTQACAPQMMEFINSSTNVSENTVFVWDFGDGSPQLTFDYTNWNQTIQHTYEVGTVDCETVVTLTAENYCSTIQGGLSTATFNPIRIWDLDDPGISASATLLCYPDTTVTFTNTTERNCFFQGNIYQRYEYWNFGDYWNLGHDSIIDWTPWPPTFPHTMHYPGVGTYTVQLLDSNFCGIAPTSITIEIVPPPIAGLTANRDTICQGESVTFYQQSTGGNAWSWNFGTNNNWINTGSGNITYVFNQAGTFTVSTSVSVQGATAGCSDTESLQIVVLPRPTVAIVADPMSGCDEFDVNYTANTSVGVVEWEWTFDVPPSSYSGQTPPPIHYSTNGSHNVSLTVTNTNGCSRTDTETIYVHPSPVAGIAVSNLCEGEIATFTSASTTFPSEPITGYTWDFGDGFFSSESNPDHEYIGNGTFDVTLIVETAHCSDTIQSTVAVEPRPVVEIGQSVFSGCSPLSVSFTNTTQNASSFIWNFGNGQTSTEVEPSTEYFNFTNSDSTYVITCTAYNAFGCGSTDTLYVTVYAGALAAFNDNNTPPGCAPFQIQFDNTSLNAGSYHWDFGDGNTSDIFEPAHLFDNQTGFIQTYNVTLYAYSVNGCNDTVSHPIIVYPLPEFEFDLSDVQGCAPLNVTMPYIPGAQTYFWNFGDGQTSNLPIPTHTFNNTTVSPIQYEVNLIATSAFGCVDTSNSVITINPGPIAQFNLDIASGCSPLSIDLTNLSINGFQFDWDYDDGFTSQNADTTHTHVFVNNGNSAVTYDILLTVASADGCVDTYTLPVVVFPEVVAAFTNPAQVCAPLTVQFDNNSLNANSFSWDFGNGIQSTDIIPSVYYTNGTPSPIEYSVTLIAFSNYGCTDTTTVPISIYPSPIADFNIDEGAACEPAPVMITNNSMLASSYYWTYGDGTSSANGNYEHTHVFSAPGNTIESYQIALVAMNQIGCADTMSVQFNLYPQVIAAFTTDTIGCAPFDASFVNQSENAVIFEWSFGDGALSSLPSPTHQYLTDNTTDIVYPVQLIAQSTYGCVDTANVNMYIYHSPLALANVDSLFGCYPQSAIFENNSIGADSYQWVYGTGQTSTTTDTLHTHTFYNFGDVLQTYNVTLNAYTEHGCYSSDQVTVQVSPQLNADFTVNAQGCSPLSVQFDNNTDGGWSYYWNFGDGDISNEFEPSHTFFNWGDADTTYNVILVVQNQFGCVDTADAFVSVFPIPQVSFVASPEEQTWPNATVTLNNISIGGDLNWEWRMGDGTELYTEFPTPYQYSTWGEYNIRLVGSNSYCSDTAYQVVVINPPLPVVDFTGPAEGCAPLTVQFNNLSEYAAISTWQFGDGGLANATNPVYTYYTPGTYTVTLTITGYDGTTAQMVQEQIIHVYPNASAAFTITPNEVSVPSQPVYCLNLSQNANSYEWHFGDDNVSNEINPIYYYQEEGIYSITLIANNEYNCPDTMTLYDAVYAKEGGMIDFPNAFTPDPTGRNGGSYNPTSYDNNIFFPINTGVTEYQLQIFNKWGEMLYESNDVNKGWDGYYRGMLCKQDVYVWKVTARFVDGQRFEQAGDVTLLIK
jgi:PKD repeat protein